MKITLLTIAAMALAATAAPALAVDHLDIVWMGNSYSQESYYQFEGFVNADPTSSVSVNRRFNANSTLEMHYDARFDAYWAGVLNDVLTNNWDYVICQEYSTRPLDSYSGGNVPAFLQAVNDLAALVNQQKPAGSPVQMAMFETWARGDSWSSYTSSYTQADAQAELRNNYQTAADNTGGLFLPVGDAAEMARAAGIEITGSDASHPNVQGEFLVGAVFYEALYGKDCRLVNYNGGLDPAEAATLKEIAHSAVPEPASLALMGLGAAALMRRRK